MPTRRRRSPQALVLFVDQKRQLLHGYVPDQHSCLTVPPSPNSLRAVPRTPLAPPLRVHLRAVLASPPPSPATFSYTPHVPCSWIWRCHKCGGTYKLGVTRRCLYDGHLFCSIPQQTETTGSEGEEEPTHGRVSGAEEIKARRTRHAQRKCQKAKQRKRGCQSEFDYKGWAAYNSWRRCIQVQKAEKMANMRRHTTGILDDDEAEVMEIEEIEDKTQKNCWTDCDFPSECLNMRLREEMERRRVKELFERWGLGQSHALPVKVEDGDVEMENVIGDDRKHMSGLEELENPLQRMKKAHFETKDEQEGVDECADFVVPVYGEEPDTRALSSSSSSSSSSATSSPPPSPTSTEAVEILKAERPGREGEAHVIDLGPNSSSCLELTDEEYFYGDEFKHRKRKKSFRKISQLTGLMLGVDPLERGYDEEARPKGPLKRVVGVGEWDDISLIDPPIVEEEKRSNLFVRKAGRGGLPQFQVEDEDEDEEKL